MAQVARDQAEAAPAWFEFGRSVLVNHATRNAADNKPNAGETKRLARALTRARKGLIDALEDGSAFSALVANAELTEENAEVLALLAAAEADSDMQVLVGQIQGHAAKSRITLGTLGQLLGPNHLGALAVARDAPLRRAALVEVGPDGPWADHPIALHSTVVWALLGDGSPDPDLPASATLFDDDPAADGLALDIPGLDGVAADFVISNGTDRMRRRQYGARRALGDRFVQVGAPEADAGWAAMVREATITGRGLLVDLDDSLSEEGRTWIDRARHIVWVLCARGGPPLAELPTRRWVEVAAPSPEPTAEEWAQAFGPTTDRTHRLTYDQLTRIQPAHAAVDGDLDAAVRRLATGRLDQLTQRIRPTRSWDDIVLSPERRDLLRSVVDRYLHANQVYDDWGFAPTPSRGLVALFSGPSGTGKTLAAEIIAGTLGLDVFKLELSSVVSKYIGETEKNLEQVFDAASAGNMVLFFDEADSLFGKRSEVKDARDRYANIEVSYLLQRLETYDGLVVMATNFEKNIDEAFLRRIHARVAFALPGPDEREAIWRRNLPEFAPTEDLDLPWLAQQVEISGGAIRNAAVQAAFVAAAADTPITMDCVVLGIAREYRKLGRLIKRADFGDYVDVLTD